MKDYKTIYKMYLRSIAIYIAKMKENWKNETWCCQNENVVKGQKCNNCGEIIESQHRHDFKYCSCKRVAVDGGKDYLRRLGKREDFTELSIIKKLR